MTTIPGLLAALAEVRRDGYAVDDEENEAGIVCLAVPAYLKSASAPSGAISVSAVRFRTPPATLRASVDEIRAIAGGHDPASPGRARRPQAPDAVELRPVHLPPGTPAP